MRADKLNWFFSKRALMLAVLPEGEFQYSPKLIKKARITKQAYYRMIAFYKRKRLVNVVKHKLPQSWELTPKGKLISEALRKCIIELKGGVKHGRAI